MEKKRLLEKYLNIRDIYDSSLSLPGNFKRLLKLILRQKHTPEEVAAGFALGLFLAFAAPPGMQLLPAAAIASMMHWNILAAVAAVFVSNPFTMPFIYPVAAYVGSYVTGIPIRGSIPRSDEGFWAYVANPWLHGRIITLLLVGCTLMGSAAALVGYFVSRHLVITGRRILAERLHLSDIKSKGRIKPDETGE